MTVASDQPRIEIDGEPARTGQLRQAALSGFGHFTAMQVRGRRVRGFRHHLARLDAANRELFTTGVDEQVLRTRILHALGDDVADASVRVYLHEAAEAPAMMVTIRPAGGMQPGPWRLMSVPYQRSIAHIKHTGDFGQRYYQRLAHAAGFDEALLTGPDGIISEGSITNIGCFDGDKVIWPAAPALRGITMQVVEPALAEIGVPSVRAHVRVTDLRSFASVFVTNARGIATVGQVDDQEMAVDEQLMKTLMERYESVPWDDI
ncbi:MAG: aminotransferase class IV [Nocardiopsaceae bacterium]|nr:aminotransferase class IV [Nocardiopsaceae bacterium]